MYIKTITIVGFKSYADTTVNLSPYSNIIGMCIVYRDITTLEKQSLLSSVLTFFITNQKSAVDLYVFEYEGNIFITPWYLFFCSWKKWIWKV